MESNDLFSVHVELKSPETKTELRGEEMVCSCIHVEIVSCRYCSGDLESLTLANHWVILLSNDS